MPLSLPLSRHGVVFLVTLFGPVGLAAGGSTPTVEQALGLKPIQKGVDYDTPTGEAAKRCKIDAVREGKSTSWVVTDGEGRTLRRFADANADNVVDTWCYYRDGLEIYRDLDADFDSKADQYRWFQAGGSRWGIDKNQDGRIDRWRVISPEEVAEEAVAALQARDAARFARLLLSNAEAASLGLGKTLAKEVRATRAAAEKDFAQLALEQKEITRDSRFVDFGAPKPGVLPAGADGATKDVTVYENATALVDAGGTPKQLLLGSLFRVGDAWRLVGAPSVGSTGPKLASVFSVPTLSGAGAAAAGAAPSGKTQQWLAELEKLDRQGMGATGARLDRITDQRVKLLENLADAAADNAERRQWYTQLADLLSAAAQSSGYKPAVTKLAQLERSPGVRRAGGGLAAHMRYRRIGAEYGLALAAPKADYEKAQAAWLEKLEAFAEAHPTSDDAADAMLQLGHMAGEFAGEDEVAERWYRRVANEFPRSTAGKKAAGALVRLGSVGKPIKLGGKTLAGRQAQLTAAPFRGRHVVVHYWASWSNPAEEIAEIARLKKAYGGKLAVLGVNLDTSAGQARDAAKASGAAWPHLFDERGLDGALATDMGVMTLPLMLVVDDRGRVVNRNVYTADLEAELKRVLR